MKNKIKFSGIFLLLIISLLVSSCGKNSSQEGLASIAFKYLKYNDFESYSNYIMTEKEGLSFLDTLERSGQYKAYSIKKKKHFKTIKKEFSKRLSTQKANLKKNFYAVFDQGARHGIVWSRAKFVSARVSKQEHVFELNGLKQQHIYIIFNHNKKKYGLRLTNNVKAKRGWVIVDGLAWEPPLKPQ